MEKFRLGPMMFVLALGVLIVSNPKPAAAHPAAVAVGAGAASIYIFKEARSFGTWLGEKIYTSLHVV